MSYESLALVFWFPALVLTACAALFLRRRLRKPDASESRRLAAKWEVPFTYRRGDKIVAEEKVTALLFQAGTVRSVEVHQYGWSKTFDKGAEMKPGLRVWLDGGPLPEGAVPAADATPLPASSLPPASDAETALRRAGSELAEAAAGAPRCPASDAILAGARLLWEIADELRENPAAERDVDGLVPTHAPNAISTARMWASLVRTQEAGGLGRNSLDAAEKALADLPAFLRSQLETSRRGRFEALEMGAAVMDGLAKAERVRAAR